MHQASLRSHAGSNTPDPFVDAEKLRAKTFVRYAEVHDTLSSTNDRAIEVARAADVELPALIIARIQTAGRGRARNLWWSAAGGLTFSLVVDVATTGIVAANWPQLSLATAVAVCDVLRREARQATIGIKWPNDVLLGGGKVCGILVESPAAAADRLVIGIGINVNNSWASAPAAMGAMGVSLCDATYTQHDVSKLLADVLTSLGTRIEQLRSGDAELIRTWQALNLLAGKAVVVEAHHRRFHGRCLEIAADAALVIDTPVGTRRFLSGSVRIAGVDV